METLNAGPNSTTSAEKFLNVATKILGGKEDIEDAMPSGIATLVIESRAQGDLLHKIPTIGNPKFVKSPKHRK
jgi:hypothetical protein